MSTLHISTQQQVKTLVSVVPSHLMAWCGASKLTVKRNFETYKTDYEHKRGNIEEFSKASRRRMMEKVSRIDREEKPMFVTLTFADEHVDSRHVQEYRKCIKAFRMRLDRAYPNNGALWRREDKQRKSGAYFYEYFPHFHILVWNVGELIDFRMWVACSWWEVCGEINYKHLQAGTSVEEIRDVKGTFLYTSKYMAKVEDRPRVMPRSYTMGRCWGTWNEENIPFVKAILCQLNEEEAVTLIRYMRRYAKINGHDFKALSIFCNPDFWYTKLPEILYGKEPKIINKSIDKVLKL